MAATITCTPFFETLREHDSPSTAIIDPRYGLAFSYRSLLRDVVRAQHQLRQKMGKGHDVAGERIAFVIENGYDYVGTLSLLQNMSTFPPRRPSN